MKPLLSILFLFPIPTTYLPTATGPTTPTGQPLSPTTRSSSAGLPLQSERAGGEAFYHKTLQCQYLKNPKHKVLKVSLSKADSLGRKPCKVCYKPTSK